MRGSLLHLTGVELLLVIRDNAQLVQCPTPKSQLSSKAWSEEFSIFLIVLLHLLLQIPAASIWCESNEVKVKQESLQMQAAINGIERNQPETEEVVFGVGNGPSWSSQMNRESQIRMYSEKSDDLK